MTQDLEESIVLEKGAGEWIVRYRNAVMGIMPIGPRLARGGPYPPLATRAGTKMEALELQTSWSSWLASRKLPKAKRIRAYS